MTLEELLKQLKKLTYKSNILGKMETFEVINRNNFDKVETLIRQFALDNHDEQLGLLQAKVYAYEQIIANSNFAPMIIKETLEQEPVLDKIRAEIEQYLFENEFGSEYRKEITQIIDKYRTESEG